MSEITTNLYLRTLDSIDPTNPNESDFLVDFNLQDNFSSTSVCLTEMSFFNLLTTVNRYNDLIEISENNGAQLFGVRMDKRNYTANEMATYLTNLLSAESPNNISYTVSYNDQLKIFTFDSDSDNFKFTQNTTARRLLGLSQRGIQNQVFTTAQNSDIPIDLSGTQFVYVCTDLGTRNVSSNELYDVLAVVPVSASYGSYNVYFNQTSFFSQISNTDISQIRITLRDDEGRILTLPSETNVRYTLAFRLR